MTLHDLYEAPHRWSLPYMLLLERTPEQNISHRVMPTWREHCAFIQRRPYKAWYYFETEEDQIMAGCVYLTDQDEIGIGVLREFRGRGLATKAIQELRRLHPGRKLANINPENSASIALFRKLGFIRTLQITLESP